MREIGRLENEDQALHFVCYLLVLGITSSLEEEDGAWTLWVENDDQVQQAKNLLETFLQNPSAEVYKESVQEIKRRRSKLNQSAVAAGTDTVSIRSRWEQPWWRIYPATQALMIISILVVALCTRWPPQMDNSMGMPQTCNNLDSPLLKNLWIQDWSTPTYVLSVFGVQLYSHHNETLTETMSRGEVWRLVTPVFIHMNVLHILFNLMWLRNLGIAVEFVRGTRRFLALVIIVAVVSNLTQFYYSGPRFGGMSGVVFGLIGYIWMKGLTQPKLGIGLMSSQVVYSIAWLLLCMTGALGPVANACHVSGFATGILIGARQAIIAFPARKK
ncbi:MAG: rhomboid family intramembrane serine protease [Planctomycetaceae bacterium]